MLADIKLRVIEFFCVTTILRDRKWIYKRFIDSFFRNADVKLRVIVFFCVTTILYRGVGYEANQSRIDLANYR